MTWGVTSLASSKRFRVWTKKSGDGWKETYLEIKPRLAYGIFHRSPSIKKAYLDLDRGRFVIDMTWRHR